MEATEDRRLIWTNSLPGYGQILKRWDEMISWCRFLKRLSLMLAIVTYLVPLINRALQLQHNNLPEP
jgi:hypothetical protein